MLRSHSTDREIIITNHLSFFVTVQILCITTSSRTAHVLKDLERKVWLSLDRFFFSIKYFSVN